MEKRVHIRIPISIPIRLEVIDAIDSRKLTAIGRTLNLSEKGFSFLTDRTLALPSKTTAWLQLSPHAEPIKVDLRLVWTKFIGLKAETMYGAEFINLSSEIETAIKKFLWADKEFITTKLNKLSLFKGVGLHKKNTITQLFADDVSTCIKKFVDIEINVESMQEKLEKVFNVIVKKADRLEKYDNHAANKIVKEVVDTLGEHGSYFSSKIQDSEKKDLLSRRRSPRAKVTLPVELNTNDHSENVSGELENLSEGGACLVLKNALPMEIDLPPCYSVDPRKAQPVPTEIQLVWIKPLPKGKIRCGVRFADTKGAYLTRVRDVLKYETAKIENQMFLTKPKAKFSRVPQSCNMYAIDLNIGCEHECLYCHFSKLAEEYWQKKYGRPVKLPIPVDLSSIYSQKEFPDSVIYLSPASDPFAPKARELTHELLSFLLPKGCIFTISTKDIIPKKTIKLLKKYHHLVEGIAMGITNVNEERNKLIEPSVPSAQERLEHVRELLKIGCVVYARMDPMFPVIDDSEESLENTIRTIAKTGIKDITGTYLFTFGRFLQELKKEPRLKESLKYINEKSYPMGGKALSLPLEMKRQMYTKMKSICESHGIRFNTCGCKETRLRDEGYPLICRNIDYYKDKLAGAKNKRSAATTSS